MGGEEEEGEGLDRDDNDDDGGDVVVVVDGEVNSHVTPMGIEVENWVRKMETSSLLASD